MAHLVASPTSSPRYLTRRAAKLSKSMNDLLVMWLLWVISSFSMFLFNVFAPSSVVVVGHGNGQKWRARQPRLSCKLVVRSFSWMCWWQLSVICPVISGIKPSKPLQHKYHVQWVQKSCRFPIWCTTVYNNTLKSGTSSTKPIKSISIFSLHYVERCR